MIIAADGGKYNHKPVPVEKDPHEVEMEATAGPREVTVSFFVNNVKKVDAIEGIVELDFQMYLSWTDPKLAGVPVEDRPPYEGIDACWNPDIEVNNNVNLETLWSVYPPEYQGESCVKHCFPAS